MTSEDRETVDSCRSSSSFAKKPARLRDVPISFRDSVIAQSFAPAITGRPEWVHTALKSRFDGVLLFKSCCTVNMQSVSRGCGSIILGQIEKGRLVSKPDSKL